VFLLEEVEQLLSVIYQWSRMSLQINSSGQLILPSLRSLKPFESIGNLRWPAMGARSALPRSWLLESHLHVLDPGLHVLDPCLHVPDPLHFGLMAK